MFQFLLLIALVPACLSAQRLSFGVVAGASPTDAFQDISQANLAGGQTYNFRAYSEAKDFLAGASIEWRLNRAWSIEADGIFRQLHMTNSSGRAPVVTWEYPILAKYHLPMRSIHPFVETGPSFRSAGNLNGTNPSHLGVTGGAGIDMHWRHIKISPTIRYTRWRPDKFRDSPLQTASNQVEFLVGFSGESESGWRPLGSRVSIGIIAGTNLTGDIGTSTEPVVGSVITANGTFPLSYSTTMSSGPRRIIAGPSIEFHLPRNFAIEIDALRRPVSTRQKNTLTSPLPPGVFPLTNDGVFSVLTWEFPVLVKRRFSVGALHPFAAVGPAFRRPQGFTTPSPFGVVAGAGIEYRWGRVKIAPTLRFTRWGEQPSYSSLRRNQSEMLVGFSF